MEMTNEDTIYIYDALRSHFIGDGRRDGTNGLLQKLNIAACNGWAKDSDFFHLDGKSGYYYVVIRKPQAKLTEKEHGQLVPPQHVIQLG